MDPEVEYNRWEKDMRDNIDQLKSLSDAYTAQLQTGVQNVLANEISTQISNVAYCISTIAANIGSVGTCVTSCKYEVEK